MHFSPDVMRLMVNTRWEGNVRELRNLVESLVVLAPEDEVRPQDLPVEYREAGNRPPKRGDSGRGSATPEGDPLEVGGEMTMDEIERRAILSALEKTGGNRTQAAELLGIGLRTLQRKLKEYRVAGKAEGN
jgi:DNA-binding NtrC family response regulator